MLTKYGVDQKAVQELMRLGLCTTEEEAIEKVASGANVGMVKEAAKNQKVLEENKHGRGSK